MLFRVDEELQSSPHSTLVKRSASLLETFDDILATNTDSVHPHEPVPPTFTSLLPAPVAVRGTVAVTIKAPLRPRVGSDDSGGDLPHVFSDPILFCGYVGLMPLTIRNAQFSLGHRQVLMATESVPRRD